MLRRVLQMLFLTFIIAAVTSCGSKVTSQKISQVKNGMTAEQVVDILGKPAETNSQSAMGLSESTYVYREDKSEVKVVFINGKVSAVQSHFH